MLLRSIEPYEKERVPKIKARLEDQLARLTSIEYDAGRLEQELIFYIEKLDVNEEKQRLGAHLNYFRETLGGEDILSEGQGKSLALSLRKWVEKSIPSAPNPIMRRCRRLL